MISFSQNLKPKFNVYLFIYLFCTSNFLALIILQPETVKLNVTDSYILVDETGVLTLMQIVFSCQEVANLILWAIYINHEL